MILTLTIFLNGKYFALIKLGKSVGLSKEFALAILWFLQVGKLVSSLYKMSAVAFESCLLFVDTGLEQGKHPQRHF